MSPHHALVFFIAVCPYAYRAEPSVSESLSRAADSNKVSLSLYSLFKSHLRPVSLFGTCADPGQDHFDAHDRRQCPKKLKTMTVRMTTTLYIQHSRPKSAHRAFLIPSDRGTKNVLVNSHRHSTQCHGRTCDTRLHHVRIVRRHSGLIRPPFPHRGTASLALISSMSL